MLEVGTKSAAVTMCLDRFDSHGEIVVWICIRADFRLFFRESNNADHIGLIELEHLSLSLHASGLSLAQSAHHLYSAFRYRLN